MIWLWFALLAAILSFGLVVFFGAPYLPTLKKQNKLALSLLNLKPGETLLDLGSGDGRLLKLAAAKGIKGIGYELNPILVVVSKLYTWPQRDLITIHWDNFWPTKLPKCQGIYVFLHSRYMSKLNKKITQEITQPINLVSFAFKLPNSKHVTEKSGMYLYKFNNRTR